MKGQNPSISIPTSLVNSIKQHQTVNEFLIELDTVKSNWQEETKTSSRKLCSKALVERNILTCAAWFGHTSIVDYIVSKWMSQKHGTKQHKNSIHVEEMVLSLVMCIAAFNGHVTVVKLLLKHVKSVDVCLKKEKILNVDYWKDENIIFPKRLSEFFEITVLDIILATDNCEMLSKLIECDIKIEWKRCFYKACVLKAEKCAEYMLHNVYDLHTVASLKYRWKNGNVSTPLMVTAQTSYKITKLLLESGVDINAHDRYFRNSLHFAVSPKYIHHEVNMSSCRKYKKDLDGVPAVDIGNVFKFEYKYSYYGNFRCWDLDEETVQIAKLLTESGIDKSQISNDWSWAKKIIGIRRKLFPNSSYLKMSPIGLLLNQIAAVTHYFQIGGTSETYLPDISVVERHRSIVEQLLTIIIDKERVFMDSAIYFQFPVWYYATLNNFKNFSGLDFEYFNTTKNWDEYDFEVPLNECIVSEKALQTFRMAHTFMELSLKLSLMCLGKLLEFSTSHSSFRAFTEITGVSWLFRKIIPIASARVCLSSSQEHSCNTVETTKQIVRPKLASYKEFLQTLLASYFKHGFTATNFEKQLSNISSVDHWEAMASMIPEVLSVLCTYPHNQFYQAVGVLEQPKEYNFKDDFLEEFEESDDESLLFSNELYEESDDFDDWANFYQKYPRDCYQDADILIKIPSTILSAKIKHLKLSDNPRPLAHMARVVIYEAMGRRFVPGVDRLTPSPVIQEYLTSFCYY